MTPKEAQKALRALQSEIGADCVILTVMHPAADPPLQASINPNWPWGDKVAIVNADTFEDLIQRLRESWIAYGKSHHVERLNAMALAVIKITDATGVCTRAALRIEKFTDEEISRLGAEAVVAAARMAGRGPFTIDGSANSNSAPGKAA